MRACVHCGWGIQYVIPKAPAKPRWVHALYRPLKPTIDNGPCDSPEPEEGKSA